MEQLFHRISQMVKAELNHINSEIDIDKYKGATATAFAAIGGIAGASIGKIGILAKGAGFSVGAVPLTAAGALTGLALYEAIRAIVEGDASSAGAAAIGSAAGAGVSAAIGGVGVAIGGTAFGVGMASMAAAGSVAGLSIAALNQLLQQGTDPEKLLDLAIEDMQEDLLKLRQAVIPVIAAQKRTLQHYEQAQAEEKKWQRRALLAVQKGDDNLARQALEQKKIFTENANTLKVNLDEQTALVDSLQSKLFAFETKVSEAKAKKAMLKARIAAAKAEAQLHTVGRLGSSSAMAAFERMEEEVLLQEARAQSAAELAGADLESQFAALQSSGNVDDELAALKEQMVHGLATSPKQAQPCEQVVDQELEALRKQLDEM
ncbi:PspA/IM30 family protein [Mastigocladopsis repens]|uniref:PspA/IM30 family protein n=1 Tax=Mastigocladopsis repens TaxID=221287 RepID=UPI0002EAB037